MSRLFGMGGLPGVLVNLRKQVLDREETWTLVIMIRNLADGRDQMAFVGAVED